MQKTRVSYSFPCIFEDWDTVLVILYISKFAEFSVCTVNYGPSFFPSILYGPSARRTGRKAMEKNENPQYFVKFAFLYHAVAVAALSGISHMGVGPHMIPILSLFIT